jgi:ADP-ribosylation factor GTPase-activating protein 1
MSIVEKYNSHTATQYRDKLAAEVEGRTWDPSQTPPPSAASSSSVGLRKPRVQSGRSSPASFTGRDSGSSTPVEPANPYGNKAVVDTNYFSGLGSANASRPDHLKPSEGGKYVGFGSEGSFTPSSTTSSRAAPTLDEIRDDPVSAISKGWGLFSSALSQASKAMNEYAFVCLLCAR